MFAITLSGSVILYLNLLPSEGVIWAGRNVAYPCEWKGWPNHYQLTCKAKSLDAAILVGPLIENAVIGVLIICAIAAISEVLLRRLYYTRRVPASRREKEQQ